MIEIIDRLLLSLYKKKKQKKNKKTKNKKKKKKKQNKKKKKKKKKKNAISKYMNLFVLVLNALHINTMSLEWKIKIIRVSLITIVIINVTKCKINAFFSY